MSESGINCEGCVDLSKRNTTAHAAGVKAGLERAKVLVVSKAIDVPASTPGDLLSKQNMAQFIINAIDSEIQSAGKKKETLKDSSEKGGGL